jgi:hypothetical protein
MGPRTTGKRGGARLLLDAFDACISFHEPPHGAPSDVEAFARQLPPDLANAIDAEVLLEHPPDVDRQLAIPLRAPLLGDVDLVSAAAALGALGVLSSTESF